LVGGPYAANQGVMVGFGLGASHLSADCDGCSADDLEVAFDFNLGGYLNPRLALLYDAAGMAVAEDGYTFTLASHSFAVQYWVAPMVWLKGGVGFAQARLSGNGIDDSELGSAATGQAAVVLLKNGNFN